MQKLLTFIIGWSLVTNAVLAQPITENSFSYDPTKPVAVRVATIATQLRNIPYADGPLGEGPAGEYDADPLYRFDRFDCTTFVETVMALAISENPAQFRQTINRIRYQDGQIGFVTRNHFPSADWIPNNIRAGFLTDITAQIAGSDVKEAVVEIDKQGWYAKMDETRLQGLPNLTADEKKTRLKKLHAEGQPFAPVTAALPYLALETIFPARKVQTALLAKIPSGVVVNIVRPNWNLKGLIGTNMNVSHQGILLRENDQLYLVHASSTAKKVVAEPLVDYLQQYLLSDTLKGINLLQINEP